jgi:hypothetical protein
VVPGRGGRFRGIKPAVWATGSTGSMKMTCLTLLQPSWPCRSPKPGATSTAELGHPRRAVGSAQDECEHVIRLRLVGAHEADCGIDAADVDHAGTGLSVSPALSSSVHRRLGGSGVTDANRGEHVGVVLMGAARGRPDSGRVEVDVLHVFLAGLMASLW